MSSEVDANQMEEALAEAMILHPILYKGQRKSSKIKNDTKYEPSCEKAWQIISNRLDFDVASCKALWTSMKQKFIKHRRKLDTGAPVADWPVYENLSLWLDKWVPKRCSKNTLILKGKRLKSISHNEEQVLQSDAEDEDVEPAQKKQKSDQDIKSISPTLKVETSLDMEGDKYNVFVEVEDETEDLNSVENASVSATRYSQSKTISEPPRSSLSHPLQKPKNVELTQFMTTFTEMFESLVKGQNSEGKNETNDIFGKLIASLIWKLPPEKRGRARVETLQFIEKYVANELKQ